MRIILNQMVVLFLLLVVGFIGGKVKLISAETGKFLSKIVINITSPCTILTSVLGGEVNITAGETVVFLLISFLAYFLFILFSIPVVRVLGGDKSNRGLYSYMAAFGNTAFMGFPVIIAIFGNASAFYVALFNIPFVLLTFSVGIMLISNKAASEPGVEGPAPTSGKGTAGWKFDPKILLNPMIVAAIVATAVAVSGFKAPYVVTEPVRLLGSITTPGSMLVIGATLAGVSFKEVFSEWRLYPVALIKLIIQPVLTWLIFKQFIASGMLLGVLVILSGMPTAAMAAMVAIEYGGNERIASGGVSMTTLMSGVTIPLIVYLLLR